MPTYVPFLEDTDFARAAGFVVHAIHRTREAGFDLGRNALDPFGAIFQCAALGTGLGGWKEFELRRQTTKAIQNAIGAFHQELLGSIPGWSLLPPSGGLDVINARDRICAEVKTSTTRPKETICRGSTTTSSSPAKSTPRPRVGRAPLPPTSSILSRAIRKTTTGRSPRRTGGASGRAIRT